MGNVCCCCTFRKPYPQLIDPAPLTSATPLFRPSRNSKILVGIHQFTAIDIKDLSFRVGDRLKLLETTGERWMLVEHLASMRRGYVPSNFVAPLLSLESYDWYFGSTSRKEAEILILGDENQPVGTFLVRVSEDGFGYSLSVKDFEQERGYHVKHFKIEVTKKGQFCLTANRTFKKLPELVSTYSTKSYTQDSLLLKPCKKPEPDMFDLSSNYRDKWELEKSEINILEKLGSGNFGEVYHAIWRNQRHVAVKTLKEGARSSRDEFLKEAAIMKTFRHRKLVRLYGVCTIEEPYYIVQEYMELGSVQGCLRKDQGTTIKLDDLLYIAHQVAIGMAHLELINYVHRDLAARNVLLGPNNVAKICDFGLARIRNRHGYCIENGEIPIKWTAPESWNGIFTIKSDVWSYGIFLMEIFTYGETPYKGLPFNVIKTMISAGRRMAKPKKYFIPDEIYEDIMLQCWQEDPINRPTFKHLTKYFEQHNAPKSYEQHLVLNKGGRYSICVHEE